MALYKRKRYSWKRATKPRSRRARARGPLGIPMVLAPLQSMGRQRCQTFIKHFSIQYQSNKTVGEEAHSIAIQLSQFPNFYGPIAAMFDQYKFNWVQIQWIPHAKNVIVNSDPQGGVVHSAIDYDDNSTATIAQLLSYSTYQAHSTTQEFKVRFVPQVAVPAFRGSSSTFGYAAVQPWLDCGYNDVLHYGWKFCIETPPGGGVYGFTAIVKASVSARGQR